MKNITDYLKQVFIIAEIGNNHNGDINTAKELIDVAAQAGADAVKFQTFRGLDIVTPNVLSSEYKGWDAAGYTYWHEFLDTIALPLDKHQEAFEYATKKGLVPFSTPASLEMAEFLESLDVPMFKISSMDVINVPLLEKVRATNKPIILSTGMANEQEVEKAVKHLNKDQLALLHCVSDYPLDYSNANLKSIHWLGKKFQCPIGFSDHSLGTDLSVASVAMGARIVEKHITLDRNSKEKAEHHFALEPQELTELVEKVRAIESALGEERIKTSDQEEDLKVKARRSLHVKKSLASGHKLTMDDISLVRPSHGAPPEDLEFFLGKTIVREKKMWEPLLKVDVEI